MPTGIVASLVEALCLGTAESEAYADNLSEAEDLDFRLNGTTIFKTVEHLNYGSRVVWMQTGNLTGESLVEIIEKVLQR